MYQPFLPSTGWQAEHLVASEHQPAKPFDCRTLPWGYPPHQQVLNRGSLWRFPHFFDTTTNKLLLTANWHSCHCNHRQFRGNYFFGQSLLPNTNLPLLLIQPPRVVFVLPTLRGVQQQEEINHHQCYQPSVPSNISLSFFPVPHRHPQEEQIPRQRSR